MLTIICYLNPDWQPGDGGELRVLATRNEPADQVPWKSQKRNRKLVRKLSITKKKQKLLSKVGQICVFLT